MSLNLSQVLGQMGDEAVAQIGEPLGLDRELSLRLAHSLAANFGLGREEAVKAAATETGLGEEVVQAMLGKLMESARDRAVEAATEKAGEAVEAAKEQAMAAMAPAADGVAKAAGGLLGRLFGRK